MRPIDVLVITAVPAEYRAVLEAGGGAGAWSPEIGPASTEVLVREFEVSRGSLRVALTQALGMGAANAVISAAKLITAGDVQCLAMCGVCAGKRGDVELGDVIVADRVWQYDAGKREVKLVDGEQVVTEAPDIEMYRLQPPEWKLHAEHFVLDRNAAWLATRPLSYAAQGDWVLERLLRGVSPLEDPTRATNCPDWTPVLSRLWRKQQLKSQKLELTVRGKRHVQSLLLANAGMLPVAKPLAVHVGPIASGSQVVADGEVFERLSRSVRKVLGVEMEAAAIGALAYAEKVPRCIVMKAVMDHADDDKSDNFKSFAARASAEVLLAFVQRHVPSRAPSDSVLVPGTSPLPSRHSPAALLRARHEIVPFQGRTELLGDLRNWCDGDGVSVKLVHAAGGMGKTRLAIELCRRMREVGWDAGFATDLTRVPERPWSDRPTLVVIDYAESRGGLRAALARAASGPRQPALRMLLLARNADEWWMDIQRADAVVSDLLASCEALELSRVSRDNSLTFRAAVTAFGGPTDAELAVPDLTDLRYERVLYVHAAALATARGNDAKPETLLSDTLDHEEHFWREQLGERGRGRGVLALRAMRLTVTALTLRGGASTHEEAKALARGDDELVVLLRDLYPAQPPRYVAGLEPDLLGEVLVARQLSDIASDVKETLGHVLDEADVASVRTAFTVLGRLSADDTRCARWIALALEHDLRGRALAALEAARVVGEATAHAALGLELARALERDGDVDIASRLEQALPHPQRTVSLREVGRWTLARLLAELPAGSPPERRALLCNNLSSYESLLGRQAVALELTRSAVAEFRSLARNSGNWLVELTMSLDNLGTQLSLLGQREEALTATLEAVGLYERLASIDKERFLGDLAGGVANLSIRHAALGQLDAAVEAAERAVALWRSVARPATDENLEGLASALANLATRQKTVGRLEESLRSAQEACAILRCRVEASNAEAAAPTLAAALSNLSCLYTESGDADSALDSASEAVDLYRKLSVSCRDAFLPGLAMSTSNLSVIQSTRGDYAAASNSADDAIEAHRDLGSSTIDLRHGLAMSLCNAGRARLALGRVDAALAVLEEAVDIHRTLAQQQPEAFSHELATTLSSLADAEHAAGRTADALRSTEESILLLRDLLARDAEAFATRLATCLNNRGCLQSARNERDLAYASHLEALDIIWPQFLRYPAHLAHVTRLIVTNVRVHVLPRGVGADPQLLDRLARFESLSVGGGLPDLPRRASAITDAHPNGGEARSDHES